MEKRRMDNSRSNVRPVYKMDSSNDEATRQSLSQSDTHKIGAVVLPGGEQLGKDGGPGLASPVEIVKVSMAQVEHTLYRVAQISAGISWSHNIPRHQAGILSSHTISVLLCNYQIPFGDEIKELIKDVVEEGLNRYYNLYGVPYTKPKGKTEIDFTRKE